MYKSMSKPQFDCQSFFLGLLIDSTLLAVALGVSKLTYSHTQDSFKLLASKHPELENWFGAFSGLALEVGVDSSLFMLGYLTQTRSPNVVSFARAFAAGHFFPKQDSVVDEFFTGTAAALFSFMTLLILAPLGSVYKPTAAGVAVSRICLLVLSIGLLANFLFGDSRVSE